MTDPVDAKVEALRLALLETFDSYHSNIREQTALVTALIAAVQRAERRRCIAIVADARAAATSAEGRTVAGALEERLGAE